MGQCRERTIDLLSRAGESDDVALSQAAVEAAAGIVGRSRSADDLWRLGWGLVRHWKLTRTDSSFQEALAAFEAMAAAATLDVEAEAARYSRILAWRERGVADTSRQNLDLVLTNLHADAHDDGVGAYSYSEILAQRYYTSYKFSDLEEAISRIRRHVLPAAGDDRLPAVYGLLGSLLHDRYRTNSEDDDLAEAFGAMAIAMFLAHRDDEQKAGQWGVEFLRLVQACPDDAGTGSRVAAAVVQTTHQIDGSEDAVLFLLGAFVAEFRREGRIWILRVVLDLLDQTTGEEHDGIAADVVFAWSGHADRLLTSPAITDRDLERLIAAAARTTAIPDLGIDAVQAAGAQLALLISAWGNADLERPAADLDRVIRLVEPVVPALTADPLLVLLSCLYTLTLRRFNRDTTQENADAMTATARALGEAGNPGDPTRMAMYANALTSRFRNFGRQEDLDEAIRVQAAIAAASVSRHAAGTMLAHSLLDRYGMTADAEDWFGALRAADADDIFGVDEDRVRQGYVWSAQRLAGYGMASLMPLMTPAVTDTLVGVAERAMLIAADEEDVFVLADLTGEVIDAAYPPNAVQEVVRTFRVPLQDALGRGDIGLCREWEARLTAELVALETSPLLLRRIAEILGEKDDGAGVWLAVAALRAASALAPHAAMCRLELGGLLFRRYDWSGDLRDVAESAELLERARAEVPGQALRATLLSDQAGALSSIYDRTGEPEVLDRSIERMTESVALTAAGSPWLLDRIVYLSEKLAHRYEDRGARADLDSAIAHIDHAVSLATEAVPASTRVLILNAVAGSYRRRFELDGDPADLDRATAAMRDALALLPDRHDPLHSTMLHNLASCLLQAARRGIDSIDPDEFVGNFRSVVELTPLLHPRRSFRLGMLAQALSFRARGPAARPSDRAEALRILRDITTGGDGDVLAHSDAALSLALLLSDDPAGASEVIALGRRLAGSPELSPRARFSAGVLWARTAEKHAPCGEALDAWSDVIALLGEIAGSNLPRSDQERLVEHYQGLVSEAVSFAAQEGELTSALGFLENGRLVLWNQALHGEGGNSAAFRLSDLTSVLGDRIVVVVTASRQRCDAILISAEGVRAVPLVELRTAELIAVCDTFLAALHAYEHGGVADYLRAQAVTSALLGWLWHVVVEPVVAACPPRAGRRRLIWCPTGRLSQLPLHAAGDDRGQRLADLAVSSYVPSLRALTRSLRRPGPPDDIGDLLTIALEERPGTESLPHVNAEVTAVAEVFSRAEHVALHNVRATREAVKHNLRLHRFVHVAGHGVHNALDPAVSGLVLADGTLTVLDLIAEQPRDAELVYLSACRTATTGARLADEAVNVAAALCVSGFRNVIGTMWAVNDATAAVVARGFHQRLHDLGTARTAEAVVDAVAEIRDRHPAEPLLWAGFIHLGG